MSNPSLPRMYLALAEEYCAEGEFDTALKAAKTAVALLEDVIREQSNDQTAH